MLGHQLLDSLRGVFDLAGTSRRSAAINEAIYRYPERMFWGIDVTDFVAVSRIIDEFHPDAVINAVGIVKQRREAADSIQSIQVNALFPHLLARLCSARGIRAVHMSTDCVFSGRFGNYADDASSDANDLYGRTKYLGEVFEPGIITLRTSIIGLELLHGASLVEWFLSQRGTVHGYNRVIYSGFTTLEMANIIKRVLTRNDAPSGVYNVSSEKIDKYTLLWNLNERIKHDVTIVEDSSIVCDRSLDSNKFRSDFGYLPPTWDSMLDGLAHQILERESRT